MALEERMTPAAIEALTAGELHAMMAASVKRRQRDIEDASAAVAQAIGRAFGGS